MWATNLKVLALGLGVISFYTIIARIIPQLESEVPMTLDLSAGVTPDILIPAGEELFTGGAGCTSCHGLGTRAPNLRTDYNGEGTIGARCGTRGQDCKTYLYETLTDPMGYIVDDFPPIMPDARRQLSEAQIWAVIAYLQSLGGEVTVTEDDISAGGGDTGGSAPAAAGGATPTATTDPMQLLTENACIGCHQIDGAGAPIGPPFDGIGSRIDADRIRRGILDPDAEIAEGFEPFAGVMPKTFGQSLSAAQLEIIVQFLVARQ